MASSSASSWSACMRWWLTDRDAAGKLQDPQGEGHHKVVID